LLGFWFFGFFFKREVRNSAQWKGLFEDNFLWRSSGTPNVHRDILLRTRLSIKKTPQPKQGTRGYSPAPARLLSGGRAGNHRQRHAGCCQEAARKQKPLYCAGKPDIHPLGCTLNSRKPFLRDMICESFPRSHCPAVPPPARPGTGKRELHPPRASYRRRPSAALLASSSSSIATPQIEGKSDICPR